MRGTATNNSGNVYNVMSTGSISTNAMIFAYGNGTMTSGLNNNSTITSQDYNVIQAGVTFGGAPIGTTTNNKSYDPQLSATLAQNGSTYGPFTDAPLNPAILDIIPYGAGCQGSGGVTTDERGQFRAIGTSHPTVCTIGAYADP